MNVLLIGSGGREHALAWKIAQSPQLGQLYIAPGNAGTALVGENLPISAEALPALIQFAQEKRIDLTIVGPEQPLALGIVDLFQANGLAIFGPTQAAAQLEASKAFAKQFMQEHGIPTAHYATFTQLESAEAYLDQLPEGEVVVKASGLAAGKGVIMCANRQEAREAARAMLQEGLFGVAGAELVIEERLIGTEVSLLAFADGQTVVPMVTARDHKRVFAGDLGPNTGGMGAFAPVSELSADFVAEMTRLVLQPTIEGMAQRGTPFVGILYAGLMLTAQGVRVLEFNCRFGDPETQVILPLIESDLLTIFQACIEGCLSADLVSIAPAHCATVVMAAPGYPNAYPKGAPISGLEQLDDPDLWPFHAGTAHENGQIVTNGGRVLAISGRGATREAALDKAYQAISRIHFAGAHYRADIGKTS